MSVKKSSISNACQHVDARAGRIDRHFCVGVGDRRTRLQTPMDPIELRRINEPKKTRRKIRNFRAQFSRSLQTRRGEVRLERAQFRTALPTRRQVAHRPRRGDGLLSRLPFSSGGSRSHCRRRHGDCASAANEMGMGTATVQIQHAAERLGLPIDKVSFQYGDSALPNRPWRAARIRL